MRYNKNEMLDLNEENVKKMIGYCLATTQTPKDNIHTYTFFYDINNINVPKANFDRERLSEMKKAINFMLGQLKVVHSKKLVMTLQDGFKKYNDKNWTVNKIALFSLYYLGVSTDQLPSFEKAPDSSPNFISPINRQSSLEPTLSPNDPEFEKWCLENNIIK